MENEHKQQTRFRNLDTTIYDFIDIWKTFSVNYCKILKNSTVALKIIKKSDLL